MAIMFLLEKVRKGLVCPGQAAMSLSLSYMQWRPVDTPPFRGSQAGSRQGLKEIHPRLERNSQSPLGSQSPDHSLSPRRGGEERGWHYAGRNNLWGQRGIKHRSVSR